MTSFFGGIDDKSIKYKEKLKKDIPTLTTQQRKDKQPNLKMG